MLFFSDTVALGEWCCPPYDILYNQYRSFPVKNIFNIFKGPPWPSVGVCSRSSAWQQYSLSQVGRNFYKTNISYSLDVKITELWRIGIWFSSLSQIPQWGCWYLQIVSVESSHLQSITTTIMIIIVIININIIIATTIILIIQVCLSWPISLASLVALKLVPCFWGMKLKRWLSLVP